MCGIVIVGSGLETWRDGSSVAFETASEEGGIFSAFDIVSVAFWGSVTGLET